MSFLGTGSVSIATANPTITVNASTLAVGGGISNGAGSGFTKAGAGTLVLGGSSSYTGNTNITAGTVKVAGVKVPDALLVQLVHQVGQEPRVHIADLFELTRVRLQTLELARQDPVLLLEVDIGARTGHGR